MKVLNRETLAEKRENSFYRMEVYSSRGAAESRAAPIFARADVVKGTRNWRETALRETLLNRMRENGRKLYNAQQKNAETGFDTETLRQFQVDLIQDIQRFADDLTDYSAQLFIEQTNRDFRGEVKLRDVLPGVGEEGEMEGTGDAAPLIRHNLPTDRTVRLKIKAFADKTTAAEMFLNPFYSPERTTESFARILADEKNADFFRPLNAATFDAAHSVPFDTAGTTIDLRRYNTVKAAINKGIRLIDPISGREQGKMHHEIYLLVSALDNDGYNLPTILGGGLERLAGVNQLAGALPITAIVPYSCGLNDGQIYGNKTLRYPGVADGVAYLYIKNRSYGAYRLTAIQPSLISSTGSATQLLPEEQTMFRITGTYLESVLPGADIKGKAAGAIIKLPLNPS
jgi:hypothetical protein